MKKKNIENLIIKEIEIKIKNFFGKKIFNLHEPSFFGNETKYLNECIKSSYVSSVGNYVNKFEKKISDYTKSKYSLSVINGTSALHLILLAAKINKNDEVLVQSLTFVASVNPILYCGAIPHFVDVENETLGIDPIKLEKYLEDISIIKNNKCINKNTKRKISALIVMHTFGHPSKIIQLKKICRKFNIILIEDAAEGIGSFYKNKHVGTFGDFGVLSFNGNKTITSGCGGMILTNNYKFYKKIKHLSTQSRVKHKFEFIHDEIGYNYRLSNINAAVGFAQLEYINKILRSKRQIFKIYKALFSNQNFFTVFKEPIYSKSNYWLQTLLLNDEYVEYKNVIISKLNDSGINVRPVWKPIHLLKYFKKSPKMNLYNTNLLYKKIINLPSSYSLIIN